MGISPGNSYFTEKNIGQILEGVREEYQNVLVMIPDLLDIHTYCALDYDQKKALEKARSNGNLMKNRVRRAHSNGAEIQILDWEGSVFQSEMYREKLRAVVNLYNKNEAFKNEADQQTSAVLENRKLALRRGNLVIGSKEIETGVVYLLKELAYLDAAAHIHTVDQAVFIYYRPWPILAHYIQGIYDSKPKPHMAFEVITPD